MSIKKLKGSCLCGQVRYAIQAEPKRFFYCHCQQCRKLTGSAHAANILAKPTKIEWIKGESKVRRYDAADGRAFTHVFCIDCGSGLPFINMSGTTLFIPAGSLDTSAGLAVNGNIFWAESADWYVPGLRAERYAKFPD